MPLNGSGTYAAPASSWNPPVTNTAVNSTDWIALLADLTTALSTAMYKDGQQTPTANIPMGGFKFTGLAAGSAAGNSLRYEQLFKTGQLALLGGIDTAGPINETKTTVASAATPDIWTSVGNVVDYTGTVTATGFAAAPQAGARRTLVCAGAAPFTAGANMLIDGIASGSTYTAIAGDRINVVAITTTQFRLTTPHTPFVDTYPIAQGSSDATKQVRLEVDGLTTGTTRTITVPDVDFTMLGATFGTQCVQNPVSSSTVTTQAHGLSRKPDNVLIWLECLTGELGYSAGDRTFVGQGAVTNFASASWDATNVKILTNATTPAVNRKDTGVAANITLADWKVVAQPVIFSTTF